MALCNGVNELLVPSVLLETLFNLRMRCASALEIALVHHDDVGEVEHHDLLQLQPAAVIRIHHQHRQIDNSIFSKRHRLLACADCLDDDVIEIGPREQREAIVCGGRKATGLAARRHAPHEHAIVLGIDHGGAIAKQGSFANDTGIVRQNRDASFRISIQKTQHQLINQGRCPPRQDR